MKKIATISLVIVLTDQLIKYAITNSLELGESIVIIKDFFNITYLSNTGAAFSILSSSTFFIIMITFLMSALIYILFIKNKTITLLEKITFGILYGGIFGNLIDRIFKGEVVDYFDFNILGYNYPVFNFADICIVISVIILIIIIYKGEKNEV